MKTSLGEILVFITAATYMMWSKITWFNYSPNAAAISTLLSLYALIIALILARTRGVKFIRKDKS